MKRLLIVAAVSSLLACSGTPTTKDGGTDGGDDVPFEFDVSGAVSVHPDAVAFLADAGQTSTFAGLTLRVEEPLKIALNDPIGLFSTQTLTAAGTYSAQKISSDLVNLGVGIGIRDDSDAGTPRVVRSATIIYDVALEGKKPSANITNSKAYTVPLAFHDQLTRAVTAAQITALTPTNPQTTLIGAGFILGRIIDATGAPVAGVTVTPSVAARNARLFYPSADLSTTQAATSSNGIFLYVHTGGDVETFRFGITGHTEYKQRNAGAAKDAALVVVVYPGTTPPP